MQTPASTSIHFRTFNGMIGISATIRNAMIPDAMFFEAWDAFAVLLLRNSISSIQISCVHFFCNIIKTAIIPVRNDRLAHLLEDFQIPYDP